MPEVDERNLAAMDLTATMAICDLADATGQDIATLLPAFLESNTAQRLYDDSLKFWWDGPDAIGEMYMRERKALER